VVLKSVLLMEVKLLLLGTGDVESQDTSVLLGLFVTEISVNTIIGRTSRSCTNISPPTLSEDKNDWSRLSISTARLRQFQCKVSDSLRSFNVA